ncbi:MULTISPECIES: glycosyltransferase family 4 protein [Lonsdalea]|uniref:Glycosyl transferase family 1 n=2 Tax=Lonsdalea TaxID=1082702 RepID=A0ACD1JA48_9GAMM|nr:MULTISPECIES: glycosyltransferase family 4 protein [Lonsdalea]RAT11651.1 glycosyl transferase family 1 [Lonsdalea quercina]RAT22017.1 glycosyl transferase family 1 [Lonsdalea populi]RAT24692.1 glycosyl transferase family 1 [Lonsdalea populi]RAT24813.1 glycosyl transferase family 1 [Lonsdalea populi]RAT34961.1 glycosyl transferase family 1 [Lonsdalea populi]
MSDNYKVGIVTDWLVTYAGAEKVLKEMLAVYPKAELYSVIDFFDEKSRELIANKHATTTFIQKFPKAKKIYQKYLPLMPLAIEQLDVSSYDVVLSSSHAVAKGVITGPDQLHISYVHSPMRYAWDLQHQYLKETGLNKGVKGFIAKVLLHKLRLWDYRTANGVDHFVANSHFIARRINKIYRREADVIYPPVDISSFEFSDKKEEFYLTASRLVPYKKVDLIVDAFAKMPDKKLLVIGDGSDMEKIKALAKPNIELLGYQSDAALIDSMQRAKAFVFTAEEDFGISPVEAQACGTPVIAFGKGGVLETVRPLGVDKPTGLFFEQQTAESLRQAVNDFECLDGKIRAEDCRENALRFSVNRFQLEFNNYVKNKWELFDESKKIIY